MVWSLPVLALVIAVMVGPATANDEPDELVKGKRVTIRTGQVLTFVAKTPTNFDIPDLATNDPTVEGGELHVFDTGGAGGSQVFPLPAGEWEVLGRDPGQRGWIYRGAGTPADPCRVVRVSKKVVRVTCRDNVTLSPPFSGDVGIIITVGTDSKRYCAQLGGTTITNTTGILRRKFAPAPGACPSSPSGAFVDPLSPF